MDSLKDYGEKLEKIWKTFENLPEISRFLGKARLKLTENFGGENGIFPIEERDWKNLKKRKRRW